MKTIIAGALTGFVVSICLARRAWLASRIRRLFHHDAEPKPEPPTEPPQAPTALVTPLAYITSEELAEELRRRSDVSIIFYAVIKDHKNGRVSDLCMWKCESIHQSYDLLDAIRATMQKIYEGNHE